MWYLIQSLLLKEINMNGAPDGDFSDSESETDTDLDELLEDLDELQWLLSQGIKEIKASQKEIEACKRTAECAAFFCVYVCIVIYIIYTISSSIE